MKRELAIGTIWRQAYRFCCDPSRWRGFFRGPKRTRLLTKTSPVVRESESLGQNRAERAVRRARAGSTENSLVPATQRKSLPDRRKRRNAGGSHSRRSALTRGSAEIPQTKRAPRKEPFSECSIVANRRKSKRRKDLPSSSPFRSAKTKGTL